MIALVNGRHKAGSHRPIILTCGPSRFRHYVRNIFRVSFRFHVPEDPGDASIRINHEGRSHDAHVFSTEHLLLGPNAVRVGNGMVDVRDEREWQFMLCLELLVRLHGIGTYTDDGRIEPLEPREGVAELARLERSPAGLILRVEIQDDSPPSQRSKRDRGPTVGGGGECGCAITFFQHASVRLEKKNGLERELSSKVACPRRIDDGSGDAAEAEGLLQRSAPSLPPPMTSVRA